jgi:hypothetical protein
MSSKRCINCDEIKTSDQFRKSRRKCKHCEYTTHKKPTREKTNEYANRYNKKHRAKVNEYKRKRYKMDEVKEVYKTYYQKNKERLKAKQRFRYKVKRLEKKLVFKPTL